MADGQYSRLRFTAAVNQGRMRVRGDTVWFARTADGRILGIPIAAEGPGVREVSLPLLYQMTPPYASFIELSRQSTMVAPVIIQRHLGAFDIDEEGNFVIGQRKEDGTRVLGFYDPKQGRHLTFDIDAAEIRAIATRGSIVYVAFVSSSDHRGLVAAYPNPLSTTHQPLDC